MDFPSFVQFCIERGMVKNKHGLEIFYAVFKDACQSSHDDMGQGLLNLEKFFYAMLQLSRILQFQEEKPFEAMFQKMLLDHIEFKGNRKYTYINIAVMGGRLPK